MKIKLELKTVFGDLIFEYECEDNTIAKTVTAALAAQKSIRHANLSYANLSSADLRSADLRSADLSSADLRSADLSYADLSYADLRSADLRSANLRHANLRSADLRSADLRYADLRSADLSSADLRSADLSSADLSSADLRYADLRSADLSSADLSSAKNKELAEAQISILPQGELIGFKKLSQGEIATLLIPVDAKRSNATGRKCRAEFARVLEIKHGDKQVNEGRSSHNRNFIYKVGELVTPDKWNENRFEECAGGIHFFITEIEAINY